MQKFVVSVIFVLLTALSARSQDGAGCRVYADAVRGQGVVITDAHGSIVGYTDHGTLDDAMQSEAFRAILCCVEQGASMARMRSATQLRSLTQGLPRSNAAMPCSAAGRERSVGPLLQNLWSQYEAPYDWLTPTVDGERCDAGCVALAMAQVMHYWRWPEHGYGDHSYTDERGCGQTLAVDFSAHYYDWDNMLGNYEGVKYSESQGYAVAQLLYDCGVAVDMKYGVEASGARVVRQPQALVEHFGYDRSCQMHYRDFYTLDEWMQMFYDELDERRPILMSGLSNRYNHAFVCDGYDERGFFHFSFGNVNGAADGFFHLPYLTPDIPPEMRPEEGEGGFNILQSMTTRIMPANHPDATSVETHLFAMSGIEALGGDTCVVHNLCNVGWNVHSDSVALALVRNGEVVSFPYVYEREFLLEEIDDTTYTDTICVSKAWAADCEGLCKLVPMFRDNGQWQAVRTSIGTPNYLIANVTEQGMSLHPDTASAAFLTLQSFTFPDWLSPQCTPDYTIELACHNGELCGRVYVLLENVVDSLPSVLLQRQGLTLFDGENASLRYYHTTHTIPEGVYNLRICYHHDLFSADTVEFDEVRHTVVVSATRPDAISDVTADDCDKKGRVGRTSVRPTAYTLGGVPVSDGDTPKGVVICNGRKTIR